MRPMPHRPRQQGPHKHPQKILHKNNKPPPQQLPASPPRKIRRWHRPMWPERLHHNQGPRLPGNTKNLRTHTTTPPRKTTPRPRRQHLNINRTNNLHKRLQNRKQPAKTITKIKHQPLPFPRILSFPRKRESRILRNSLKFRYLNYSIIKGMFFSL